MDIAAWLASIGLERYGPAFRENEIDLDVLGDPCGTVGGRPRHLIPQHELEDALFAA